MQLPSRKVLSVFILTASLVASIILAFGKEKGSAPINFASNLIAGEKVALPENPNWQNELGKISLLNADLNEQNGATSSVESTTDTISRTLVSNYLALKQSGNLDQESAQKLIDQTIGYVESSSPQIGKVTKLNVVADNGKISIAEYGDNLGTILRNSKPQTLKNEVDIITRAVESNDPSKLDELDSIIDVYKDLTVKLMRMQVPQTFVKAHLDIVNGMREMAIGLMETKKVASDPFVGLSAINIYKGGFVSFSQALKATSTFINESGAVYKQGSGGYYLLYGI